MNDAGVTGELEILDIRTTQLSRPQRDELLARARWAVDHFLQNGVTVVELPEDPMLRRFAGAFVTLWKKVRNESWRSGEDAPAPFQLRGCIGHIEADRPLFRVISEMAVQAATRDHRFPQLTPGELKDINFEISVMSPLEAIEEISQVEIGIHGLVVVDGRTRGLLLPEVPLRFGWNPEEFARQVCHKAGLPVDAWRRKAVLYRFATESFSEQDHL